MWFLKNKKEYPNTKLSVPEFQIVLNLSEKATKRIWEEKESIIVYVYLWGIPSNKKADDFHWKKYGELFLMREEIELLSNEMITFDKLEIPEYKFNWLEDKNYRVNISAYTGRKSSENNLIHGDGFFGRINSIAGKKIELNFRLIRE